MLQRKEFFIILIFIFVPVVKWICRQHLLLENMRRIRILSHFNSYIPRFFITSSVLLSLGIICPVSASFSWSGIFFGRRNFVLVKISHCQVFLPAIAPSHVFKYIYCLIKFLFLLNRLWYLCCLNLFGYWIDLLLILIIIKFFVSSWVQSR